MYYDILRIVEEVTGVTAKEMLTPCARCCPYITNSGW